MMCFLKFLLASLVLLGLIALLGLVASCIPAHADPPGGRAEVDAPGILIHYNGCRLALPNSAGRAAMAAIAYWNHEMSRKDLARIVDSEVFPGNYEVMRLIELCKGA